MPTPKRLYLVLLAAFALANLILVVTAADLRTWHNSLEALYTRAHSLGDDYEFHPGDGWQTVNASSLHSRYTRGWSEDPEVDYSGASSNPHTLERRANKKSHKSKSKAKTQTKVTPNGDNAKLGSALPVGKITDSLKAIGKPEPVLITWYTGHDLLNPSCWSNPTWAPTDASFACALTLEGWTTRPKCFKFLELCNTPKKCVFVRVVDSCAGCAKGSKHVDLTQAAFKELASLDEGLLQVQMRQATDPIGWLENLWGPKH